MIYVDYAATSPPDPQVLAAMLRIEQTVWANPSSVHELGRAARREVEDARQRVAALIGAPDATGIYFTSSGTEANNLAILGVARFHDEPGQIVTTAIEHASVLEPLAALEKAGWQIVRIQPDETGFVHPEDVIRAVSPQTALVCVMAVNNEVATMQAVAEIGEFTAGEGVPLHVDAVQAAGVVPIDVSTWHADFVTLSAHKLYGPKGVGALWVRGGVRPAPLLFGGAQERRLRPGTEDVAAIAGFGVAAELAQRAIDDRWQRLRTLRLQLVAGLSAQVAGILWNGAAAVPERPRLQPGQSVPGIVNLAVPDIDAETMLFNLDLEGIAAAAGAACSAGSLEPSHVISAMGRPELAGSSVRLSLGTPTTTVDVDRVVQVIATVTRRIRERRGVRV